MTKSKNQASSIQQEIEKLRDENRWNKLKEYVGSLSAKESSKSDWLPKFSLAEADLEIYLFSNPLNVSCSSPTGSTPVESQSSSTTTSPRASLVRTPAKILYDAEVQLKSVLSSSSSSESIQIQTSILLAKLFYSLGRYEEATNQLYSPKLNAQLNEYISKLRQARQHSQQQTQQQQQQYIQTYLLQMLKNDSMRQLQLYAEGFALKGLCLEAKQKSRPTPGFSSSSYRMSDEDEQDIIDSYEIASQFAIQHSILMYQKMSSLAGNATSGGVANTGPSSNSGAGVSTGSNSTSGPNTSTGGSAPNSTEAAITASLSALNSTDDNLDLINPLYEISLQKAPLLYIKKGDLQMGMRKFRDLLLKKNIQSITSIRQILLKKFAECLIFNIPSSQYVSPYRPSLSDEKSKLVFKPNNQDEEILLCLSLSQYLASKEVMLFRQAQYQAIREYTFNNAINSLDLLIFYLSYNRSFSVLADKFELTMKYSFEQFYLWYQNGLTLLADQKYYRAYMVFKECIRMKPDHVGCHLLLARIAIEYLYLVNEAIDWCHKVHELTGYKNKKAYILFGCAMCFKAKLQKQHSIQISYYEQALDSFKKAHTLDPGDYLPLFHIAHCYSILRQINDAIDYVQRALKLKPDDKDSLHLLALLLTSVKNYEEAHTIMCKVCAAFDDYELLFTKIRIEEALYGFNHSYNSLMNLVVVFKQRINGLNSSGTSGGSTVITQSGGISQGKNIGTANPNENWSSFESASLLNLQHTYKLNEAMGKSVTMLIQSDQLAFKYGNNHLQSKGIEHTLILVRILAQIGEFYLRHNKLYDAEMCCQEIAFYHPLSYLYIYLKGRIFEYKQDYQQAKLCYQNALSINPHHIPSLQQMAVVMCETNNYHLSEKMIRDAISLNSSLSESWNILARVLDCQNDTQSALKCYQTCLQLESTNPILPFTSITRIF